MLSCPQSVALLLTLLSCCGGAVGGPSSLRLIVSENGVDSRTGVEAVLSAADLATLLDPAGLGALLQQRTSVLPLDGELSHAAGAALVAHDALGRPLSSANASDGDVVYLVPQTAELHWVWPTRSVGDSWELPELVAPGSASAVRMRTLSKSPRVFAIDNFLSDGEIDELVSSVLSETDPQNKLQRSTTGHTGNVLVGTRTSHNAFDTGSEVATRIKQRAYDMLRIPFDENSADGLQVLRYNASQAYIPHTDYFDASDDGTMNFDPSTGGVNRFATVFLYLSDVEAGGATVFPQGERFAGQAPVPLSNSSLLEGIGIANGSWEADMVLQCETQLAVHPRKGTAMLFYSQSPHGIVDPTSEHGGCPVLAGTKWAANLWVWNKNRFQGEFGENSKLHVNFANELEREVSLFWGTVHSADADFEEWAPLAAGSSVGCDTYHEHRWQARHSTDGEVLWEHKMSKEDGGHQDLTVGIQLPSERLQEEL